ncbi:MAG TPA: hypothetical protein VFL13_04130 [Candidatus Baltobacteraceae bacterium]|nr:hypothetical protein [Candidatus Baltobacteraceae bacterium]
MKRFLTGCIYAFAAYLVIFAWNVGAALHTCSSNMDLAAALNWVIVPMALCTIVPIFPAAAIVAGVIGSYRPPQSRRTWLMLATVIAAICIASTCLAYATASPWYSGACTINF